MSYIRVAEAKKKEGSELITLLVKIVDGVYLKDEYSFKFEIYATGSLMDLHFVIQDIISFDNDHLFSFSSGKSIHRISDDYGDEDEFGLDHYKNIFISDIFPLPNQHKLFYLFDFGDNWLMEITEISRRKGQIGSFNYQLLSEKGIKPQQYPSFDEIESEEDLLESVEERLFWDIAWLIRDAKHVYLYPKPIPMYWGWKRLSELVQTEIGFEVTGDRVFLFYNKKKDRLRILFRDHVRMLTTFDKYLTDNSFIIPVEKKSKCS